MQENRNKDFLQSRFFTVGHDPFCAWYVNGTDDALLRGMDTKYFQYLAETHGKNLDGENRQRAAVALRTSYYHGLETLFMLIFAALQSPHCIVAWLSKCEPKHLRKFVGKVTTGELPPIWKWELSKKSWDGISSLIHRRLFAGHDNSIMMQGSFARLWEKLAEDYTAQHMVYEYNNFKHGFRVRKKQIAEIVDLLIREDPAISNPALDFAESSFRSVTIRLKSPKKDQT
jgi:hypothetical protein